MIRHALTRWLARLLASAGHETRRIATPRRAKTDAYRETHAALMAKLGPRQQKRRRLML